ncbi:hypothetical protein C4578_01155 [Candidatus Microgenomates bacterium]|jgi:hypothetical protein|nr:MAG: hypothetical protein C4578_01155 [Candidatus Microgenomates bacterium]
MTKKVTAIFLALVFISPWFWLFVRSPGALIPRKEDLYQRNTHEFISEVNSFQSESRKQNIGLWGKIIVNKATFLFKDAITRYSESFDFHFLFIEGDLDVKKTTRASGPLYLSFLPFIAYGFALCFKKKDYWPIFFVFISPALAAFFNQHYETLSRIPFILSLTALAAMGINAFSKLKGYFFLKSVFIFFLIFEFLRFVHYYFMHHPYLLLKR